MIKTCENCRFYGGNCPHRNKCVRTNLNSIPSHWTEMTEAQKLEITMVQLPGKKLMGDISTGYALVDPMTLSINIKELYPKVMEVKNMKNNEIKNVIFNDPATIVIWSDGSKTVVKCGEGEVFDPEKGLAMAIAKHALGNEEHYYEIFKKWIPEEHESKKRSNVLDYLLELTNKPKRVSKMITVKELSRKSGVSESTIRKQINKGQYPNAKKVDGKWLIPYFGDDLNDK